MRKEYDLTGAKPGNYWKRIGSRGRALLVREFLGVARLVQLDADVFEIFPDEASVNEALRLLVELGAVPKPKSPRPRKAAPKPRKRKAA